MTTITPINVNLIVCIVIITRGIAGAGQGVIFAAMLHLATFSSMEHMSGHRDNSIGPVATPRPENIWIDHLVQHVDHLASQMAVPLADRQQSGNIVAAH